MYPDAESAALEVEGYDAHALGYLGADGTVYKATAEGPGWGPVTLHPTQENRLSDLVRLLRAEADHRHLTLPPETPDESEAIWDALLAAQGKKLARRRSEQGRWRQRRAKRERPQD